MCEFVPEMPGRSCTPATAGVASAGHGVISRCTVSGSSLLQGMAGFG